MGEGGKGGDLGGGRRRYGGECDQNILYNIVQEVTKELPNFNLCLTMCGPLCRLCLCLTMCGPL